MRSFIIASVAVLALSGATQAQTTSTSPAVPAAAAGASDGPVPRAERAKARQDCLSESVALSGDDLRAAMRLCMEGKFPGVQLYAKDGLTRDGKPTAVAARKACKDEIDSRGLQGSERVAALTACFNGKRPDLAQRAECRKDARAKGLDGADLRKAIDSCAREGKG